MHLLWCHGDVERQVGVPCLLETIYDKSRGDWIRRRRSCREDVPMDAHGFDGAVRDVQSTFPTVWA